MKDCAVVLAEPTTVHDKDGVCDRLEPPRRTGVQADRKCRMTND